MILKYIVTNNNFRSINQILKQELNISARLQHKLIEGKHIYLNGSIIDTRSSVSINDIITVNLDFDEENDNIVPTYVNEIQHHDHLLHSMFLNQYYHSRIIVYSHYQ